MKQVRSGGGWPAIVYTLRKARQAGGVFKLWRAMRTRNACKTCALGMGGQRGGMVNETGHFPEVCKKSLQAMVADMQAGIPARFFQQNSIDQLQRLTPRELEACGRLVQPLLARRGQTHYRPIDWDDALERIAGRLKAIPAEETFWYFSGRSSNEAGFLLQLFARILGTNHVNNCSYYCHQASGAGLTRVTGSGTATVVLEDLDRADLVFVIGGNPASNHPRLMTSLMRLRRRGGRVVVINPVVETGLVRFRVPSDVRSLLLGSSIASLYVQPDIGGDLALLTGVAKRIDRQGAIDREFLDQHCVGWPELAASLRRTTWDEIVRKAGVDRDTINAIAELYASADKTIFSWTMGITHHEHGVQNVQAIANLALMRGMVGRAGAGLMPIRGHSNVQGIGSVGVTPQLKREVFERLETHYGVPFPSQPGLDTLGCVEAADRGELTFGCCLGGNLYGANPDASFARWALSKLDMLVYLNTTLNTGHVRAIAGETLILPVLARDEEPQATTQESMFNYVRLSDGGAARHAGPRSEVEVIAALADRVLGSGGPIDWRSMRDTPTIREAIGRVVPGFEKMREIDRTREEFQIGGRTFHTPAFATPDGMAHLHALAIPERELGDGQLRLMTVRSEGQFNTVVYEEEDLYRGVHGRDVILVHPHDIERFELADQQRVTVRSATSELHGIRVHAFPAIKPGNVLMYYPEANELIGRRVDPIARTPAFKGATVTLIPTTAALPPDRPPAPPATSG